MQYDYKCSQCDNIQEEEHSAVGFKEFEPKCKKCGSVCKYTFTPTIVQFALKDGPSGSWASKGIRFKNYRAKQNENMKKRQRDRYGHLSREAIPNYKGKETETWANARSEALKDKGPEVASTYNAKVASETKSKKKIIV